MKRLFFLFIFVIVLTPVVQATWFNTTFRERQEIQIRNRSPVNATNYTIFLRIPYDSDMRTDFSDLLFSYYNSTSNIETLLYHWVQNYSSSNTADVWIGKFELRNSTDLSNNNATLYMYYKNNTITPDRSLGNKTFIYFANSWNIFDSLPYWTNESTSTDGAPNEDDYSKANQWIGYHNIPQGTNNYIKESKFNFSMTNSIASKDGLMARMYVAPQAIASCGGSVDEFSHYTLAIENFTQDNDGVLGNPTKNSITVRIPDRCNNALTRLTLNCNVASADSCFAQTFTEVSDTVIGYGITNFGFLDLLYSTKKSNTTLKWREGTYISATNTSALPRFEKARLHFSIGVLDAGVGTTSRMAVSWIFVKNHIQPEAFGILQASESFAPSKIRFYVNRTNTTLARKGSKVIHNINFTNNNSISKIVKFVFETNITGSVKNYTNLTSSYSRFKANITNVSSSTGKYYWKAYAETSNAFNDTNKMLVQVDATPPSTYKYGIKYLQVTTDLNQNFFANITDNLAPKCLRFQLNDTASRTGVKNNITVCNIVNKANTSTTQSYTYDASLSNAFQLMKLFYNDTSGNWNTTANKKNFTIVVSSGGGDVVVIVAGGGGGGQPLTCNVNATKYSITTSTGTGSYVIRALPGTKINRKMIFQNLGADELKLSLTCNGDVCDDVILKDDIITLEPNIEVLETTSFTYTIPDTAKFGETIDFSIIARDDKDKCSLPLAVEIIVSRLSISSLVEKFSGTRTFFGFAVPNFVTFLASFVLIGLIGYVISSFIRIKAGIAVGFIAGLIGAIIIMIVI